MEHINKIAAYSLVIVAVLSGLGYLIKRRIENKSTFQKIEEFQKLLSANRSDSSYDNLAVLCLKHHDHYDSRTSQSKGLMPDEVGHYKLSLVEKIKSWDEFPHQQDVYVSESVSENCPVITLGATSCLA